MFVPKKAYIQEFAKLAVINGVNVQKGQPLVINAPVEAYELARECVDVAYGQGASRVTVNYIDDHNDRAGFKNIALEELVKIPKWREEKKKHEVETRTCYLHILGSDPDLYKGIDPNKIQQANLAYMKVFKKYQYYTMNNIGQWSIIAYPNLAWAKKVFPKLKADDAMEALWKAILKTSRVQLNKTMDNWSAHNKEIHDHSALMNKYNFKSLHFKNSVGTDLVVGLVKNHIWEGGFDTARGDFKVNFNPNIPSEEVFTMPDCYHIDGKVVSTKPLSYNGNIIEQFSITYKDGKVIDFDAKNNKEVLKNLIEMDEGTKSLGEVALISYNSPISKSGILFYETLFDENASCHLAIGACYPTNIKGGADLSRKQLKKLGGNDSMEHVDFMFGSKDMSIVGETYDGKKIQVFKNGNFVI